MKTKEINDTNIFCVNNGVLEKYNSNNTCVIIPEYINVIGKNAFKGCEFLEKVILNENITKIDQNAFKGCKRLKEINFPKSLEYIGEFAFYHCHSLSKICIGENVKSLEKGAFLGCDNLEEVSIKYVESLKGQVFFYDREIRQIEINNNLDVDSLHEDFVGCNNINRIIISNGQTIEITDVTNILSCNEKLIDVLIPKVVKGIIENACKNFILENNKLVKFNLDIKNVDIPNGVKSIAKNYV